MTAICFVAGKTAGFWIFLDNQQKQPGCNHQAKAAFPGEGEAEAGVCGGDGECGCSV